VILADYLLHSLFGPKDEGRLILRNVGELLPDYTALHPRRQYSLKVLYQFEYQTFHTVFPIFGLFVGIDVNFPRVEAG
jgi:hypothetical protein